MRHRPTTRVTPEEVIAKVREAAAQLGKEGQAGLAAFEAEGSPFIWKDTYVFVSIARPT